MPSEKALALVLRTTDWSETSRIATLWTREFGKVRALAKGGRRLKSAFESALDLLTLCRIVFVRKSSGSLDLLTEAQVTERFPRLRQDLPALYAAYYVAELLSDWTQEYDPHPTLFDEAVGTLRELGSPEVATGPRAARFEMVLLRELGYSPALDECASCGGQLADAEAVFSPAAGGLLCSACAAKARDGITMSAAARAALGALGEPGEGWQQALTESVRGEIRKVLSRYVTYLLGHRPRLLPYLGS